MRSDDSHSGKGATQIADDVVLILDYVGRLFRSKEGRWRQCRGKRAYDLSIPQLGGVCTGWEMNTRMAIASTTGGEARIYGCTNSGEL